ncbi:MAG: hypothetical protein PHW13_12090 [Methylococcales bacterium]|nr:hypothetical protein [Methylococcales bacterium]
MSGSAAGNGISSASVAGSGTVEVKVDGRKAAVVPLSSRPPPRPLPADGNAH